MKVQTEHPPQAWGAPAFREHGEDPPSARMRNSAIATLPTHGALRAGHRPATSSRRERTRPGHTGRTRSATPPRNAAMKWGWSAREMATEAPVPRARG